MSESHGKIRVHVEEACRGRLVYPETNVAMLDYEGSQEDMIRDRKRMGGSDAGGVEWQQRRRIHGTDEGGKGWGVGGRRRADQRKEEVRRKGLRGIREIHRSGRGEGWGVGGG